MTAKQAKAQKEQRSMKQLLADRLDPGICLIVATVAATIVLVVLGLMFPAGAGARVRLGNDQVVGPDNVRQGSLLFRDMASGNYSEAKLIKTDVAIDINGMIVFARVVQEFENSGDAWLEGVYVFPLPENAAVSRLTMDVGDRVIEGIIQEREQARETYRAAKKAGRKTSLLEQERPNIFMISVANIGPHETIRVELEYQQTVHLDNAVFSLRFPTVVGPRYIPGEMIGPEQEPAGFEPLGWGQATIEVADANRITPPVVEPGQDPVNPVSLEVILDPGFNLGTLESLYHSVDIDRISNSRARISLSSDWVVAERDFVLQWGPAVDSNVQAALFAEEKNGGHYLYLMVMPPAAGMIAEHRIPREVIFVVDVSGSMGGPSIEQAKQALAYGVSRLEAGDRFNIIAFNDSVDTLFRYAQTATADRIDRALHYIAGLKARGGTEIAPALYEALDGGRHLNRIRQVIFLTDGCVGNEQQLFQMVRQRLGDTRLFTVGIGSAPNSYFMRNIAARGKGTFTYIGKVTEVAGRMQELFTKIENPLLTDITISGLEDAEMFPGQLPDLYLGEPVTLVARTGEVPGNLLLSGMYAGSYWERRIDVRNTGRSSGISILWARQKIKGLMDSLDGDGDREQVRAEVTATALEYHLVSRYTSLVAVDVTPARPAAEELNGAMVRTNLPAGWQYEKVFNLPQTGTVAQLCLMLGVLALLLATIIRLLILREERRS